MKLKKLDLCGFKSFPEPTEICFHDGITATVGPNGCGKSNVIDAVRWVMGETSAKGLRGDSMEDVIFAGSDSRKPLHLAEVTLTLTEAEHSLPEKYGGFHEVAITRRLLRSGESEYLINKVPCRLKDITEFFMDTGVGRRAYSLVEQGRIDAILSTKPKDRRFLIEEAAGITKYRTRKEEALRKMERTAHNLQRLADVLGEVRREMNSLKRQASRAGAFKRLRAEKRELERDLMVAAWEALACRVREAAVALEAANEGLVGARARSAKVEVGLEEGRLLLVEDERAMEQQQRAVYDLKNRISQREGRVDFLEQDAANLSLRAERAEEEARELEQRSGTLAEEVTILRGELGEVEARIREQQEEEAVFTGEHEAAEDAMGAVASRLEAEKKAVAGILGELTRVNHALEYSRRQQEDCRRRLDAMAQQEGDIEARHKEIVAEIELRRAELARAETVREDARADRGRLEDELKQARLASQDLRQRAEEARRALHTDQSRLQGLQQLKDSLEGYGSGVKTILKEARKNGSNGIRGVVADIITAPAEYEPALEAALGEKLQYVIVEEPDRGMAAVQQLKSLRAGRSSFAPVNVRCGHAPVFPDTGEPWVRGPILDLVEVAPDYRQLAASLLGDVCVVDSLEHAVGLWRKNGIQATLVTLDGETVSLEGVISGGSGNGDKAGLLRKNREIRELGEVVRRRGEEVAGLQGNVDQAQERVQALEAGLESAREELHRHELQALHIAKDLGQLEERLQRLVERREVMDFEREELVGGSSKLDDEAARLAEEKRALTGALEEAEGRVARLSGEAENCRERVRRSLDALTAHRVAQASDGQRRQGLVERIRSLGDSVDSLGTRVVRLQAEGEEARAARAQRVTEHRELKAETERLRGELGVVEAALTVAIERVDQQRTRLAEEEREAVQARRVVETAQEGVATAELASRDLELRAEALQDRFRERLGAELAAEAASGIPEGFVAEAAEAKVRELEQRLANFGEINLLAIEEYEERKGRCDFLEGQKADLEESLTNLKQAISRINRVSRERFAETFEEVSRTFHALYPKLFRGGEAKLVLTDPEDMLETGIEIIARPPGKRPQHIGLLSGGEKALTAVALIFSVFLVKPSPFCILDEVDAPLDEANIGRFCDLLREMAASSQFLVVTHNKATMEAADHLYGITMGEPGVSKVVSVRLTEQATPARAA